MAHSRDTTDQTPLPPRSTAPIALDELIKQLNPAVNQLDKIIPANSTIANAIILLGRSSAGKSTAFNRLLNRKLTVMLHERTDKTKSGRASGREVVDTKDKFSDGKIGHSQSSTTSSLHLANITTSTKTVYTIIDTPGFCDSRGAAVDMGNALLIAAAVRACKQARLVLMINVADLRSTNGLALKELLETLTDFFNPISEYLDSFIVFFSHCQPQDTADDIILLLEEMLEAAHFKAQPLQSFLNHMISLLSTHESALVLTAQAACESQESMLSIIEACPAVEPRSCQSCPLSELAALKLNQAVDVACAFVDSAVKTNNYSAVQANLNQLSIMQRITQRVNLELVVSRATASRAAVLVSLTNLEKDAMNAITNLPVSSTSDVVPLIEQVATLLTHLQAARVLARDEQFAFVTQNYNQCIEFLASTIMKLRDRALSTPFLSTHSTALSLLQQAQDPFQPFLTSTDAQSYQSVTTTITQRFKQSYDQGMALLQTSLDVTSSIPASNPTTSNFQEQGNFNVIGNQVEVVHKPESWEQLNSILENLATVTGDPNFGSHLPFAKNDLENLRERLTQLQSSLDATITQHFRLIADNILNSEEACHLDLVLWLAYILEVTGCSLHGYIPQLKQQFTTKHAVELEKTAAHLAQAINKRMVQNSRDVAAACVPLKTAVFLQQNIKSLAAGSRTIIDNSLSNFRQALADIYQYANFELASLQKQYPPVSNTESRAEISAQTKISCNVICNAAQQLQQAVDVDQLIFASSSPTGQPTFINAHTAVQNLYKRVGDLLSKVIAALDAAGTSTTTVNNSHEVMTLSMLIVALNDLSSLYIFDPTADTATIKAFMPHFGRIQQLINKPAEEIPSPNLGECMEAVTNYRTLFGTITETEIFAALLQAVQGLKGSLVNMVALLDAWRNGAIITTRTRLNELAVKVSHARAVRDPHTIKTALDELRWLKGMDSYVNGTANQFYSQATRETRGELDQAVHMAQNAIQRSDPVEMAKSRTFLAAAVQQGLGEHLPEAPLNEWYSELQQNGNLVFQTAGDNLPLQLQNKDFKGIKKQLQACEEASTSGDAKAQVVYQTMLQQVQQHLEDLQDRVKGFDVLDAEDGEVTSVVNHVKAIGSLKAVENLKEMVNEVEQLLQKAFDEVVQESVQLLNNLDLGKLSHYLTLLKQFSRLDPDSFRPALKILEEQIKQQLPGLMMDKLRNVLVNPSTLMDQAENPEQIVQQERQPHQEQYPQQEEQRPKQHQQQQAEHQQPNVVPSAAIAHQSSSPILRRQHLLQLNEHFSTPLAIDIINSLFEKLHYLVELPQKEARNPLVALTKGDALSTTMRSHVTTVVRELRNNARECRAQGNMSDIYKMIVATLDQLASCDLPGNVKSMVEKSYQEEHAALKQYEDVNTSWDLEAMLKTDWASLFIRNPNQYAKQAEELISKLEAEVQSCKQVIALSKGNNIDGNTSEEENITTVLQKVLVVLYQVDQTQQKIIAPKYKKQLEEFYSILSRIVKPEWNRAVSVVKTLAQWDRAKKCTAHLLELLETYRGLLLRLLGESCVTEINEMQNQLEIKQQQLNYHIEALNKLTVTQQGAGAECKTFLLAIERQAVVEGPESHAAAALGVFWQRLETAANLAVEDLNPKDVDKPVNHIKATVLLCNLCEMAPDLLSSTLAKSTSATGAPTTDTFRFGNRGAFGHPVMPMSSHQAARSGFVGGSTSSYSEDVISAANAFIKPLSDYLINEITKARMALVDQLQTSYESEDAEAFNRFLTLAEDTDKLYVDNDYLKALFPHQLQTAVRDNICKNLESLLPRGTWRSGEQLDPLVSAAIAIKRKVRQIASRSVQSLALDYVKKTLQPVFSAGQDAIINLGLQLRVQGNIGYELLADLPEFEEIQRRMRNEVTSKMTADHAFTELAKENPHVNAKCWENLREVFENFETHYRQLLNQYILSISPEPLRSLKASIEETSSTLRNRTYNSNVLAAPQLLAKIFCMWTALSVPQSAKGKVPDINGLLRPHPVQVLGILRLLGADDKGGIMEQTKNWLKNVANIGSRVPQGHAAQLRTGEGKSVLLGALAAYLALLGIEVHVACYSSHLSQRDAKAFALLFETLKIDHLIQYDTIDGLMHKQMSGVKEKVKNFLTSSAAPSGKSTKSRGRKPPSARDEGTADTSNNFRVLLFDEIDVFLRRSFFGDTFNPAVFLDTAEGHASQLLRFIFESKTLTLEGVQSNGAYQALLALVGLEGKSWLDGEVRQMLQEIKQLPAYRKEYGVYECLEKEESVSDGAAPKYKSVLKVGYLENDTVNFNKTYGYLTAFAWLQEVANGRVKLEDAMKYTRLVARCGLVAYARMPNYYGCVLGVTGTLDCLSDAEKRLLADECGITKLTFLPSIYGISQLDFKKNGGDVMLTTSRDAFYQGIIKEVDEARKVGRPCLIYFESIQDLEKFKASTYGQSYCHALREINAFLELTEVTPESQKQQIVRQAMDPGKVLLSVKELGRGIDFQCEDRGVNDAGGVVTIQTFYSELISEEIQIAGRTARQGKRGAYRVILHSEDLCRILNLKEADVVPMKDGDLYGELNKVRVSHTEHLVLELKTMANEARGKTEKTLKFWKALDGYPPPSRLELMKMLRQMKMQRTLAVDLVVVMDCTGSMGSWMQQAKDHAVGLVKKIEDRCREELGAACDMRMGFVAYRDFSDGALLYDTIDLTDNVEEVKAKIAAQPPSGGGDYPEDPIGGMKLAVDMSWNEEQSVKLLILVADAPSHGPEFCDPKDGDSYPNGPPVGHVDHGKTHMQRLQEAMAGLQEKQVRLVFTQIVAGTIKFETALKNMAPDMELLKLGQSPEKLGDAVQDMVFSMLQVADRHG